MGASGKIKLIVSLTLTLLLAAGVYGMVVLVRTANLMLESEHTLHAMIAVGAVLEAYIQAEGQWPRSWEDLDSIATVETPSMYQWPKDRDQIKTLVTIDFTATLAELASQEEESFAGLQPANPDRMVFPTSHYIPPLLETVRDHVEQ